MWGPVGWPLKNPPPPGVPQIVHLRNLGELVGWEGGLVTKCSFGEFWGILGNVQNMEDLCYSWPVKSYPLSRSSPNRPFGECRGMDGGGGGDDQMQFCGI